MNNEIGYSYGCSEEFAELCALSTSGELSPEELALLEEHVAGCVLCAELLKEYTSLTKIGMAKLAAELDTNTALPISFNEMKAEERFIAAYHGAPPTWASRLKSPLRSIPGSRQHNRLGRLAILFTAAAVLAVCVAGSFEFGRKIEARSHRPVITNAAPLAPVVSDAGSAAKLAAAEASLAEITAKSAELERQFSKLSDAKSSLLTQLDDATRKEASDAALLASVIQQRDALQQQLNDTSTALVRAREDLSRSQQDRQWALYRVAALEAEAKDLHTELANSLNSANRDEKFLAADRDIRELMGARELYIADVFDVQNNGVRSKPFGRVFYTKGKQLIFYAFDLQSQPGFHEAKTFQAWGRPDNASSKPISLGIFYEDSEQSRRWVVKSDNPGVLSQINAVFVTVEPRGGSQKPTGKPFLEAYMHSLPPNHP